MTRPSDLRDCSEDDTSRKIKAGTAMTDFGAYLSELLASDMTLRAQLVQDMKLDGIDVS